MLFPIPKQLKRRLKNLRQRARNAYANRFLSFTPEDLGAALRRVGVAAGDTVLVHSSFDSFLGFQGSAVDVLTVLQKSTGALGTILMPQQAFSGSAVEWALSGQVFDVRRTPTRMGLLPEMFRRMDGVSRSLHPTHSVAAWGARAQEMLAGHEDAKSPCGHNSPYMHLYEMGGKILHLGSPFSTTTFLHTVDELLRDQMPFSPLTAEVYSMQVRDGEGRLREVRQHLFDTRYATVRRPDRLLPALRQAGLVREEQISRLRILLIETRPLVEAAGRLAEQNFYFYDLAAMKP